jgi:hypothetical protein
VSQFPPETQYVQVSGAQVGYQVVGDGPIDLLFTFGFGSNIELTWDSAHFAEFLKGFATPAAAIKTLHLTMPTVLYDATAALNPAPGQWAVRETPTVYVINPGGVITTVLQANLESSGDIPVSQINRALAQTNCGCALKSGPGVP